MDSFMLSRDDISMELGGRGGKSHGMSDTTGSCIYVREQCVCNFVQNDTNNVMFHTAKKFQDE